MSQNNWVPFCGYCGGAVGSFISVLHSCIGQVHSPSQRHYQNGRLIWPRRRRNERAAKSVSHFDNASAKESGSGFNLQFEPFLQSI